VQSFFYNFRLLFQLGLFFRQLKILRQLRKSIILAFPKTYFQRSKSLSDEMADFIFPNVFETMSSKNWLRRKPSNFIGAFNEISEMLKKQTITKLSEYTEDSSRTRQVDKSKKF